MRQEELAVFHHTVTADMVAVADRRYTQTPGHPVRLAEMVVLWLIFTTRILLSPMLGTQT